MQWWWLLILVAVLFVIGGLCNAYLAMKGVEKGIPEYKKKMRKTDDEDDW